MLSWLSFISTPTERQMLGWHIQGFYLPYDDMNEPQLVHLSGGEARYVVASQFYRLAS